MNNKFTVRGGEPPSQRYGARWRGLPVEGSGRRRSRFTAAPLCALLIVTAAIFGRGVVYVVQQVASDFCQVT